MIQLVIIGNGFDLAHGNKTSYSDFFKYIIKKYYRYALESSSLSFNNDIVDIKASNTTSKFEEIEDYSTLLYKFRNNGNKITFQNNYISEISSELENKNWADIESLYYKHLTLIYRNGANIEENTNKLNKSFDLIKRELIDYLLQISINPSISSIKNIFRKIINQTDSKEKMIFLNFNYTNTLSIYQHDFLDFNEYCEIKIHGSIEYPDSIIFGYGDESDSLYRELEKANQNYLLDHIKSFYYIKSNNYARLFKSLDNDEEWHIHILGHSCGVSDRILLKELFDNDNCKKITIYPYKKENGTLDVTEKVQQISRHFTGNSKHKMRRIITFDKNLHI